MASPDHRQRKHDQQRETVWEANKTSKLNLTGQLDYYGKLSSQFPIAALRLVYAKAGTLPAACLVEDDQGVIDHMLYWMAVESREEGRYLTVILNSETARQRVAAHQARGQFGARHFDKVIFNLPIPRFDAKAPLHQELARAALQSEKVAAAVALLETVKFQRARQLIRAALADAGISQKTEDLVVQLLEAGK
jgi:hypothetical protein